MLLNLLGDMIGLTICVLSSKHALQGHRRRCRAMVQEAMVQDSHMVLQYRGALVSGGSKLRYSWKWPDY